MRIFNFFNYYYLKFKYPNIDIFNSEKRYGVFSLSGIDTYIYASLYNLLIYNPSLVFVEISRPKQYKLSILNLFLHNHSDFKLLIFDEENLYLKNIPSSQLVKLENNSSTIFPMYMNNVSGYRLSSDIFEHISKEIGDISFFSFCFLSENLDSIIDLIVSKKLYSILIYDNPIRNKKSLNFRDKLISFGYVYYSRIDYSHDFFILSDCINGFPSESFKFMPISNLAKWISVPSNSDFTKPI